MERVCFLARVRPGRLDEVPGPARGRLAGDADALRATGWGNYSLFLTGEGLLVGYLETDDFAAAQKRMRAPPSTSAGRKMGPYFEDLDGARPDEGFRRIDEIFHLD